MRIASRPTRSSRPVLASVATAATNSTLATQVVNSSSDLANPAHDNTVLPLPLGIKSLLSVDAVHTVCSSSATGSTGGTTVANLVIGGTPIPVTSALNQVPTLPAALSTLLSVEINKQVVTNSVGATGITVDGVVISLLGAVGGGAVITLSESKCGATGPDINATPDGHRASASDSVQKRQPGPPITITGTGFQCVTGVKFGTTTATPHRR